MSTDTLESQVVQQARAAFREAIERLLRMVNSHPALLAACKAAQGAMGAHGPCKNNSCRECRKAWDLIRAAIAQAEGRA